MEAQHASSERLRFAELTSAIGAGVLGVGVGAIGASYLRGVIAAVIVVVGLLLHGWGMTDKHRIEERSGASRPAWSTALYWICWLALVGLIVYIVMRAAT